MWQQIKMEQQTKREVLSKVRADSINNKLKRRIETLARNFQSKLEVKQMTDLNSGENLEIIRRQEELNKIKYLQVVIGKTQMIKNKLQSHEEQRMMNKEIYARKIVLSELKSKETEAKI